MKNSKQCTLPCLLTSWEGVGGGGQLTFSELKENCTFFTLLFSQAGLIIVKFARLLPLWVCSAPTHCAHPIREANNYICCCQLEWFYLGPILYHNQRAHEIFIVNWGDIGIQHQENPHLASRHDRGYSHSALFPIDGELRFRVALTLRYKQCADQQ